MGNGYRLPTESEWAWAARFAGENGGRRYPWGDDLPPPTGSGNYADRSASSILANTMSAYNDGFAVSAPVGSANPNGAGLYDLGGNVAEWVQDFYTIYPRRSTGSLRNPMGPQDGAHHVIRGSSWMHWSVTQLRFAYRDYGTEGRVDVGFRIVRYVK
jgi:formylglycine-generating enzyme required for sulfatase activity